MAAQVELRIRAEPADPVIASPRSREPAGRRSAGKAGAPARSAPPGRAHHHGSVRPPGCRRSDHRRRHGRWRAPLRNRQGRRPARDQPAGWLRTESVTGHAGLRAALMRVMRRHYHNIRKDCISFRAALPLSVCTTPRTPLPAFVALPGPPAPPQAEDDPGTWCEGGPAWRNGRRRVR